MGANPIHDLESPTSNYPNKSISLKVLVCLRDLADAKDESKLLEQGFYRDKKKNIIRHPNGLAMHLFSYCNIEFALGNVREQAKAIDCGLANLMKSERSELLLSNFLANIKDSGTGCMEERLASALPFLVKENLSVDDIFASFYRYNSEPTGDELLAYLAQSIGSMYLDRNGDDQRLSWSYVKTYLEDTYGDSDLLDTVTAPDGIYHSRPPDSASRKFHRIYFSNQREAHQARRWFLYRYQDRNPTSKHIPVKCDNSNQYFLQLTESQYDNYKSLKQSTKARAPKPTTRLPVKLHKKSYRHVGKVRSKFQPNNGAAYDLSQRFIFKTLRDDEYCFINEFSDGLLYGIKHPLRKPGKRRPYTVRLGKKPNSMPAYECVSTNPELRQSLFGKMKAGFTTHQSTSVASPNDNYKPIPFGHGKRDILVGMRFDCKDVLVRLISDYDKGTVGRTIDFDTKKAGLHYIKKSRAKGKRTLFTSIDELITHKTETKDYSVVELLTRLRPATDGSMQIVIFTDNLESRLLAQLRALDMNANLRKWQTLLAQKVGSHEEATEYKDEDEYKEEDEYKKDDDRQSIPSSPQPEVPISFYHELKYYTLEDRQEDLRMATRKTISVGFASDFALQSYIIAITNFNTKFNKLNIKLLFRILPRCLKLSDLTIEMWLTRLDFFIDRAFMFNETTKLTRELIYPDHHYLGITIESGKSKVLAALLKAYRSLGDNDVNLTYALLSEPALSALSRAVKLGHTETVNILLGNYKYLGEDDFTVPILFSKIQSNSFYDACKTGNNKVVNCYLDTYRSLHATNLALILLLKHNKHFAVNAAATYNYTDVLKSLLTAYKDIPDNKTLLKEALIAGGSHSGLCNAILFGHTDVVNLLFDAYQSIDNGKAILRVVLGSHLFRCLRTLVRKCVTENADNLNLKKIKLCAMAVSIFPITEMPDIAKALANEIDNPVIVRKICALANLLRLRNCEIEQVKFGFHFDSLRNNNRCMFWQNNAAQQEDSVAQKTQQIKSIFTIQDYISTYSDKFLNAIDEKGRVGVVIKMLQSYAGKYNFQTIFLKLFRTPEKIDIVCDIIHHYSSENNLQKATVNNLLSDISARMNNNIAMIAGTRLRNLVEAVQEMVSLQTEMKAQSRRKPNLNSS